MKERKKHTEFLFKLDVSVVYIYNFTIKLYRLKSGQTVMERGGWRVIKMNHKTCLFIDYNSIYNVVIRSLLYWLCVSTLLNHFVSPVHSLCMCLYVCEAVKSVFIHIFIVYAICIWYVDAGWRCASWYYYISFWWCCCDFKMSFVKKFFFSFFFSFYFPISCSSVNAHTLLGTQSIFNIISLPFYISVCACEWFY